MSITRPARERAADQPFARPVSRRQFLGFAAAAAASIGGASLIGTTGTAHNTVDHAATPAASPAASPVASPIASGPPRVDIVATDIRFEPNMVAIPANTEVVLVMANEGVMPHDVIIPSLGVNSGRLASGESVEITVTAPAGSHALYCSVPGHMQAGMRGTLSAS
jgi:nitrite reductase (NO-forming)